MDAFQPAKGVIVLAELLDELASLLSFGTSPTYSYLRSSYPFQASTSVSRRTSTRDASPSSAFDLYFLILLYDDRQGLNLMTTERERRRYATASCAVARQETWKSLRTDLSTICLVSQLKVLARSSANLIRAMYVLR